MLCDKSLLLVESSLSVRWSCLHPPSELWTLENKTDLAWFTSWPLVGNEGINLYIGILGIHSLIPY